MAQQFDTQAPPLAAEPTREEARLEALFADPEDPIQAIILAAARDVLRERDGKAAC